MVIQENFTILRSLLLISVAATFKPKLAILNSCRHSLYTLTIFSLVRKQIGAKLAAVSPFCIFENSFWPFWATKSSWPYFHHSVDFREQLTNSVAKIWRYRRNGFGVSLRIFPEVSCAPFFFRTCLFNSFSIFLRISEREKRIGWPVSGQLCWSWRRRSRALFSLVLSTFTRAKFVIFKTNLTRPTLL